MIRVKEQRLSREILQQGLDHIGQHKAGGCAKTLVVDLRCGKSTAWLITKQLRDMGCISRSKGTPWNGGDTYTVTGTPIPATYDAANYRKVHSKTSKRSRVAAVISPAAVAKSTSKGETMQAIAECVDLLDKKGSAAVSTVQAKLLVLLTKMNLKAMNK